MFIIVQNCDSKEIYNVDHISMIFEKDESALPGTSKLFPYSVVFTVAGEDRVVFSTDDKFQLVTVMAALAAAVEKGETITINNPNGSITHGVLIKRLQEVFDGKNRIHTIRTCRQLTGWGLREAKKFCDDNIAPPPGPY